MIRASAKLWMPFYFGGFNPPENKGAILYNAYIIKI